MTASADAAALVASAPCCTVLPAGAGKTELLAHAVGHLAESNRRSLFLTHTNAGVDAFKRRLSRLGVDRRAVDVWTIAGWCESWCRRYPTLGGLEPADLVAGSFDLYQARAVQVFECATIRRVIRATWAMAFIDEYQDCRLDQHASILAMSHAIPVVAVGDPLQGVYNFPTQPTVRWADDVDEHYPRVELASEPHRWATTNPRLGEQLSTIRVLLERGSAIDLRRFDQVQWKESNHYSVIPESKRVAALAGNSVVIHSQRAQCIRVARSAGGELEALEDLQSKDLFALLAALDEAEPPNRMRLLTEFADKCISNLPSGLKKRATKIYEGGNVNYRPASSLGSFTRAGLAARHLGTAESLRDLCRAISALDGIVIARRELWSDLDLVLTTALRPDTTIASAADEHRSNRRRHRRRPLDRTVGTPLLVKGLEYDNVLVIDAHNLSSEALYVALTRGRYALSVLSDSPVLDPSPLAT